MNGEIPLEIEHVRERLHRDYIGLIVGTGDSEDAKTKNFRSKALAAFAIHRLTGCSLEDSAKAIVDGGADGGIDALYLAPTGIEILIVQSKFMNDGKGEPSLGDVAKFREGIENLMLGRFDGFAQNESFRTRLPDIRVHLERTGVRIRIALVYSGINPVTEERLHIFEKLEQRFSNESDDFTVRSYNLTSIHDWLTGAQDAPGVDVQLALHQPARFGSPAPFEMYYGLVGLKDLAELYVTHATALVTANIREYKGLTSVNKDIQQTLLETPEHFPYLNNGLTAYCAKIRMPALDRDNRDLKRLELTRFCIVNGAQTLGSVKAAADQKNEAPDGFAFIKIISLERCENEHAFAQQITRATNFQNQVNLRDFASLDPQQDRIASHLELSGIHYHYRDSDNTPDLDSENFIFDEALIALACLENQILEPKRLPSDPTIIEDFFCARVLSNRESLRNQNPVFGTEPFSRYHRIFKPNRSARTVWLAVQTYRQVLERMKTRTQEEREDLRRKSFFTNARWLVLHLVFHHVHPERNAELQLNSDLLNVITKETDRISELLWTAFEASAVGADPKTIFSRPTDCYRLKGSTLAELNRQTLS